MLGKRVLELREKAGLKQRELAVMLGCSTSLIASIETERQDTSLKFAAKISKLFGVSMDWLVFGSETERLLTSEEREILDQVRNDEAVRKLLESVRIAKKQLENQIRA